LLAGKYIHPAHVPFDGTVVGQHSRIGSEMSSRKKENDMERDGIGIGVHCGEVLLRTNP
jgi:hypothetical protein